MQKEKEKKSNSQIVWYKKKINNKFYVRSIYILTSWEIDLESIIIILH